MWLGRSASTSSGLASPVSLSRRNDAASDAVPQGSARATCRKKLPSPST